MYFNGKTPRQWREDGEFDSQNELFKLEVEFNFKESYK
jgi:hypothetical protein